MRAFPAIPPIRRTAALLGGAAGVSFDFYVDSVGGSNANDGLTPGTAKQTIAAAQALLSAGKSLGLCRGSKWRETFTFQYANITIGVYGDENDDPPILDGRDVVATTWTQPNVGTYPNVWSVNWTRSQAASTGSAWLNLWVDGEFERYASNLTDLETNGGFWLGSRTATTTQIYIKSTVNPNSDGKVYEASTRGWAFKGHKTTLGVDAPLNQQIVGPIECVGYIEHYNALAGGPGQSKQLSLLDGNIHHSVTEGDLTEDVLASRIIPGALGSMFVAYRIIGTGLSHTFRRCLAFAKTGATRTSSDSAFYCHGSTPTTTDSLTIDQCITRGAGMTGDTALMTISNLYTEEAVTPIIGCSASTATVNVNRVQVQDLTSLAAGTMAFRCLSANPIISIDNFCARIILGTGVTLFGLPSTPPVINRSALVTVNAGIGGTAGFEASLTMNNSIVITTGGRVLNSIASPYVGDYNVFQGVGTGVTAPVFSINGFVDSSLSAWQTRTSQDANSVWLKGSDQTAGNADAFWLGVATNANAGPADGDWRINPSAKVYNGAGTAFFGTFADGTTPITEAGPQEHWNYNTRAVVAGPPTRLLTLPTTKTEERQYINDPTAWDFYA